MLKFLVDESSGKKLSRFLQEKGFDVLFAADRAQSINDREILQIAKNERRVLITNDKDFGELLFRLHIPSAGVVLLRLKKDSPEERRNHLMQAIEMFSDTLASSFVVITEGKVRIRKL